MKPEFYEARADLCEELARAASSRRHKADMQSAADGYRRLAEVARTGKVARDLD